MTDLWAQRWRGPEKVAPAIAALIVNALIGYALIMGLRGAPLLRAVTDASLALFDLKPPEKRPEPVEPRPSRAVRAKSGGTPHAPAARPRREVPLAQGPIMVPAPVIAVPSPPMSPVSSPDAGGGLAGGVAGEGGGSGKGANGTGVGVGAGAGDAGAYARARQTGGSFRNSDFPAWLKGTGRLKIGVRYAIAPSGRVEQCEIIEQSGYAEVDAMTCRIIMERYRFRPARDPAGYAVTEVREEDYRWRVR